MLFRHSPHLAHAKSCHRALRCRLPASGASLRPSLDFPSLQSIYTSAKHLELDPDDVQLSDNDFILSILKANPQSRDTRSYLDTFGSKPNKDSRTVLNAVQEESTPSPILASILNPVQRRTALVKIQGPFTDRQLHSIARGLVYLQKLGLVSVIVVENDELHRGEANERPLMINEVMRVVTFLEDQGARSRPLLDAPVRLGPAPIGEVSKYDSEGPEAHTLKEDLNILHSAIREGEIPVLPPFALDSHSRSVRIDSNHVLAGLARGMAEAGQCRGELDDSAQFSFSKDIDITPMRLMVINREGGVPSYARSGLPHLLINLESEFNYIHDTFVPEWQYSHPTALSNLSLARMCLSYMPSTASAIMVSHRSPSSLIANLITNKPAVSSSLPHALLQGNQKLTPHTPTLLRRGLSVQVLRSVAEIDKSKMNTLLEQSFRRQLDASAFYERLEKSLDFVIVAGDYAGAAIVTNEGGGTEGSNKHSAPISYLDKFAVHPTHQGDGTVDFLWVALHDESYGLGHPFSANPNGGKGGEGEGRDLVWRSRANNPVNKWYFERSTGHLRQGDWILFWCDAEKRLRAEAAKAPSNTLPFVTSDEAGRLEYWMNSIMPIPSVWR